MAFLGAAPPAALAQEDCFENAFCLQGVQIEDNLIGIRIRNLRPGAITMRLNMELENLSAQRALPLVVTIPGERTVQPIRLTIRDKFSRWGYRFDAQWVTGTLSARHNDAVRYMLPFDRGAGWLVGQGYNGRTTHQGKYALDFDVPEGTPVRASRAGRVVEVEDRFVVGGADESLRTRANFVKVEHDDGTVANYVHLRHRGVRVRPGQEVRVGDLLGLSGNTGFTTGPHLHFEVYGIDGNLERRTFPVDFLTTDGTERLVEGRIYTNPTPPHLDADQSVPARPARGWNDNRQPGPPDT